MTRQFHLSRLVLKTLTYFSLSFSSDSCDVPDVVVNLVSSCYDFYLKEKEDKLGWDVVSNKSSFKWSSITCPENWKYRTEDDVGDFLSRGVHSFYGGGGYVANLGYQDSTARYIVQDLVKNAWIDRQTRVVLVEFSMFNVATNQLADVTLYFEMLPSGFLGTSLRINVIPMSRTDSASTTAYLIITLLYAFFLGYYTVTECIRAYRLKCAYLKSVWNWLEMLQILSALGALGIYVEKEKRITQVLESLNANPFVSVSFHDAFFWFDIENHIICMAATIATLRFLRLFKFNSHIIVLFLSMKKSVKPIMSYAVVFLVVFIAYGHAGCLLFGKNIYMFSSIHRVIISQLLMALGGSAPRKDLESVNLILARLYMISFLFVTMVMLINMFVAILNDVHAESTNANKGSEDMVVASLLLSKFLKLLGITRQQRVSSKTNEEDESFKEHTQTRKVSVSKPEPSSIETEEMELSVKIDVGLTKTETDRNTEPSKLSSPLTKITVTTDTHAAPPQPPLLKSPSDESSKRTQQFGVSPPTDRKAVPSISLPSFDSIPPSNSPDIRGELPFLDRRNIGTVHFDSNVHVRSVSVASSDVTTSSIYSPRVTYTQGQETGSRGEEAAVNTPKTTSSDASSVEVHSTATQSCAISEREFEKPKKKIIDFDEVSERLKRINSCGNTLQTISDFPGKMGTVSSDPQDRKHVVDFDTISKMIKIKRKAKRWRKTASDTKTKQLISRAKRLDQLLYLLD